MNIKNAIVWLRNDLRLSDNPALFEALQSGASVTCVYVLDESEPHALGSASRWWLHHSLYAFSEKIEALGGRLILRSGDPVRIIPDIVSEASANAVYWNRRYAFEWIECDKSIKEHLLNDGVAVYSFNGSLLREPWELQTGSGGNYRVFSPFWRALQAAGPTRDAPLPAPSGNLQSLPLKSDDIQTWALTPTRPDWAQEISQSWTPGEDGAHKALSRFLDGPINSYKEGRDRPDCEYVSRLSPHLAFGEISPVEIWAATQTAAQAGKIDEAAAQKFLSEIAWREFSYSLLYYFPDLPRIPLRQEFSNYPWQDDQTLLSAWRKGQTGYPIVDAGLRQLWRTGWMHNRVRMIAASFLIKDLLIDWRAGADWFWDTLVDADAANNAASWQWVAGCGADAAPYFRIFNPVTQGKKFDPDGDYVRLYVPEIAALPAKYIHAPWEAPEALLETSGITLGKTYPLPIVDHAAARKRALAGYDRIKQSAA